jgi:hypothetical protein
LETFVIEDAMIRRTWRVLLSAAALCTMPAALRAAGTVPEGAVSNGVEYDYLRLEMNSDAK